MGTLKRLRRLRRRLQNGKIRSKNAQLKEAVNGAPLVTGEITDGERE